MDHKFTGPRYTIGIEEELMILDADTLELANAIKRDVHARFLRHHQYNVFCLESLEPFCCYGDIVSTRGQRGSDIRSIRVGFRSARQASAFQRYHHFSPNHGGSGFVGDSAADISGVLR